jgi:MerR family transcriptional regulator, light-induced transcriptional regulator
MSEFFRRDGWDAWIEADPTSKEFTQVVRDQWFDVVEFLVSGDKQLDALAARIRTIRRESPNRSIGVMVYGQVFIEHPELVLLVGADVSATDPRQGALQAQRLLSLTDRS